MSDGISHWHDDMDVYEARCKRYQEPIQYSGGYSDCYGKHANLLEKRAEEEFEIKEKKKTKRITKIIKKVSEKQTNVKMKWIFNEANKT